MKTCILCIATLSLGTLMSAQVRPDSTVPPHSPHMPPPGSPSPCGTIYNPCPPAVSPSVQAAAQLAFVQYNKDRNPVDASTFALAYGTWVGNLQEGGYFDSLASSLQKNPEGFVNLRLSTDQANQLSLRLANAGVKIPAQKLMEASGRSTDLERMDLIRSIATPSAAQAAFASVSKEIQVQPYLRDPNDRYRRTVADDNACKRLSNLMMLNVYSGNTFGAMVTASALVDHCN